MSRGKNKEKAKPQKAKRLIDNCYPKRMIMDLLRKNGYMKKKVRSLSRRKEEHSITYLDVTEQIYRCSMFVV